MKISGWSLIRLYTILVYVFMFVPIVVVMVLSFNPKQFGCFPMTGVSLKWFAELARDGAILTAFKNSMILGACTSVISTAIGILAAMAFVRFDFPGKNTFNTLLLAPIMIPEVILGVALLLFLRWLQQPKSFALLVIGHVVLTLPYVLLIVQARLVGIKKEYEEAAQSLGANAFQTFKEITFPLLAPAILGGVLFSFTISLDDITATLFWATAQNQTLPVKIFGMLRNSISPEINALGTIMVILTVAIPLFAGYLIRKFSTTTT
ncbi:MAG: ABC transporter permease [Thermoplasmata archaeon]|nr:MAG: spermidine/putrescine ABC transporter permease [Desulfobacteraceae bacterium 4484_190.3]RLB18281.1 MAG: ABC transporter permease [Deltaproteobacteria bacterium]RLF60894.1 MAG: ABC transporter permease [Thermoplasmata archaeon]